ncbi:hypothetical protein K1719_024663 [Acacia pycnantha]|nr:hypothetical protein K1719_024663 [Acacia pycnantha]
MKAQREFKVEVLTEKEALKLFCMKVGEETLKSNLAIRNIAQEMARECKGLPLAVSVVGSVMAGVRQHSTNNLTNSSWTSSALKIEIHVVVLIEKWIGEGFLDIIWMRSVHDMHFHGGSIIEKLKLSCLLENVDNDMDVVPSIKKHDVIRDMALWIGRDQDRNKKKIIVQEDVRAISQANVENWEMVERISILNGVESWIQSKSWTSLRTLLLHFKSHCGMITSSCMILLDLEKVRVPHPKETNFQSKVLFTTRFEDVCVKMKAQREFKVEVLTEKEVLKLFCMKVGEETLKSNLAIRNIAQEMARECKGLPLAVSVVGSVMAGVRQHSTNNLTNSSWTSSALEIEIHVVVLIEKWIGEGFLDIDWMRSVHDMHFHGGSIIEKLKLSCLLENVDNDMDVVPSIKKHDVIRDMALWIGRDQDRNKKKIIVQEDVRAISQANVENWEMEIILMNASQLWRELKNLKSLKIFQLILFDDNVIPLELISNLRQLKVFRFQVIGVRDEREEEEFVEELECSSNLEELWVELTTDNGLNKLLKSAKLQSYIYALDLRDVGAQVNGPLLFSTMCQK